MHIKDFILRSLKERPGSSRLDLCHWFEQTMEAPPTFQGYHMRDALYWLEGKGKIHRVGCARTGHREKVLWSIGAG